MYIIVTSKLLANILNMLFMEILIFLYKTQSPKLTINPTFNLTSIIQTKRPVKDDYKGQHNFYSAVTHVEPTSTSDFSVYWPSDRG